MSSSSQKGNIGTFLLSLTLVFFLFIIFIFAKSMITEGIPAGKYNNPNVSSFIVNGSIYDVNGRALSMEIPSYDCFFDISKMNSAQLELAIETTAFYSNVSPKEIKNTIDSTMKNYLKVAANIDENAIDEFKQTIEKYNLKSAVTIEKNFIRNYPAMFHASQLIAEVEDNLSDIISPRPGFNKATTYGDDVYLTIDLDVQYIMDLAVQDLYTVIPSDYVYGFVLNAEDGSIAAMSTYPYYDLNEKGIRENIQSNKALLSDFSGITPHFISKIVDVNGKTKIAGKDFDISNMNFTVDYPQTINSLNTSGHSAVKAIPALEKPKYYIIIGVSGPSEEINDYISKTAEYVADGLKSQSKL